MIGEGLSTDQALEKMDRAWIDHGAATSSPTRLLRQAGEVGDLREGDALLLGAKFVYRNCGPLIGFALRTLQSSLCPPWKLELEEESETAEESVEGREKGKMGVS